MIRITEFGRVIKDFNAQKGYDRHLGSEVVVDAIKWIFLDARMMWKSES